MANNDVKAKVEAVARQIRMGGLEISAGAILSALDAIAAELERQGKAIAALEARNGSACATCGTTLTCADHGEAKPETAPKSHRPHTWTSEDRARLVPGATVNYKGPPFSCVLRVKRVEKQDGENGAWIVYTKDSSSAPLEFCDPSSIRPPPSESAPAPVPADDEDAIDFGGEGGAIIDALDEMVGDELSYEAMAIARSALAAYRAAHPQKGESDAARMEAALAFVAGLDDTANTAAADLCRAARAAMKNIRGEALSARAEADRLRGEVARLTAEAAAAGPVRGSLWQDEIERHQRAAEAYKTERDTVTETCAKLRGEVVALTKARDEATQQVSRLRSHLRNAHKDIRERVEVALGGAS